MDSQTNRILDWGQNSGVVGAVHGGIDGGETNYQDISGRLFQEPTRFYLSAMSKVFPYCHLFYGVSVKQISPNRKLRWNPEHKRILYDLSFVKLDLNWGFNKNLDPRSDVMEMINQEEQNMVECISLASHMSVTQYLQYNNSW